jgi:F-type H+-transporting ATPase subunit a
MDFNFLSALPNLTNLFAAESAEEIGWGIFAYYIPIFLVIFGFIVLARKGVTNRQWVGLPARLAEHLYLFLENMSLNVIGKHGKKYVPALLSFWLLIFVSNVFGLIFDFTPTAEWSLNISLAIFVVVYVQVEGIKQNGLFGHLGHFAGPRMAGAMVLVSALIFVVEITSELMKLLSLSLRLYGNIHGGHIVVSALNSIINIPIGGHNYPIPAGGLLLPIKLFTCLIQAYVFVILTCTYLGLVTHEPHDDHGHDDHGHAPAETLAAA